MKKFLIVLMLCLSLVLPSALAESAAPYTPGSITENLFADAFARGDMVTLDMQFFLTLAENAESVFGEDTEMLHAVCEVLENSIFTVGAGKIDGGFRVMLAGDYTSGADTAALDAALDLTKNGVVLTSNVIPGESVSAKWETLLALTGASEEEITSIMSLRDVDLEALLGELLAQLQPMLDMVAQIAAPYGETIMAHIAALPMVVNENVPAEYGYPAAATEVQIQVTSKAVGDLIVALAEQVKQDATLCALIDMALAETATADAPAPTTAQLCDAIAQSAAQEFTDETRPLNLFIGMDAAGNLLYFNATLENENGTYSTISLITGMLDETGAKLFNLDVLDLNAEQEILDGFSLVLASDVDETNPNVTSLEALLGGYADGAETLSFSFYVDNDPADFEGFPGYIGAMNMALHMPDGETAVSMNMDADITSIKTAENSEEVVVIGSMEIAAGDEKIPMTFEGGFMTEVIGGAPVAVMTESARMPALGIADWSESYTLSAFPQETEPLTETALETASPEALEALAGRAMESLEAKLTVLFELLPPQLLEAGEETALPAQP